MNIEEKKPNEGKNLPENKDIKSEESEENQGSSSGVTAESEIVDSVPPSSPAGGGEGYVPSGSDLVATNPGRRVGWLVVFFVAVLLVLVGGIASYYYYTFLGSGSAELKQIRKVWQDTVIVGNELDRAFKNVNQVSDLASLVDPAISSNRTLRDLTFDLPETTVGSKDLPLRAGVAKVLDNFVDFVGEVKLIAQRGEEIEKADEADALVEKSKGLENSYDELLLLAGRRLAASLPRTLFEFAPKAKNMIKDYVDSKQEEENKKEAAVRQAAEAVVTAFMQSYKERDPDRMIAQLTPGAQDEFNPAILQESSELASFRILETNVIDTNKVEVRGREQWQTPDEQTVVKERNFRLIKIGDSWKIDTWDEVSR